MKVEEIWNIVLGTSLAVVSGVLLFCIELMLRKFQNKKKKSGSFTLHLQDPS